jgi:hypothetical protein
MCISTEDSDTSRIHEDSIELEERVVSGDEQVGVEPNCTGRMQRVGGPNPACLQFQLLKLNSNCCGR